MRARSLALAALVLASAPFTARAVDAPIEASARRSVEVEVFGSAQEAHQLQTSLGELLGRIGLELRLTIVTSPPTSPSIPSPSTVVLARVDLRDSGTAAVVLLRPGSKEGTARIVPQRDSRELLLEETALVIYAGAESLAAGPAAGAPDGSPTAPPDAPSPVPKQAPKPPPSAPSATTERSAPLRDVAPSEDDGSLRGWALEGAMLVSSRAYADDAWVVGGVELGARARLGESRWLPGLWLLGAFHFPFRESAALVELSTSVWSARLVPSLEVLQGRTFRFELGAGGGADVFVAAPESSLAAAELSGHREDASPVLTALAAGSLTAGHGSRFVLAASLDWDLAPRRYVIAQNERPSVLLEPLRVRPGVSLGLLLEAAGSERRP